MFNISRRTLAIVATLAAVLLATAANAASPHARAIWPQLSHGIFHTIPYGANSQICLRNWDTVQRVIDNFSPPEVLTGTPFVENNAEARLTLNETSGDYSIWATVGENAPWCMVEFGKQGRQS